MAESAEQDDIGKRLGLDYLVKAGRIERPTMKRSSQAASDLGIQEFAYRQVLTGVSDMEKRDRKRGVRLSEVGQLLALEDVTLLPLARDLEEAGLLETRQRSFGDPVVTLTTDARRILKTGDMTEISNRLGFGAS
jgi:hypothetical protein